MGGSLKWKMGAQNDEGAHEVVADVLHGSFWFVSWLVL
jgi:hypothetical protein